MLTSRVESSHMDVLRDVNLAPCLVQEEIIKRADIRVTVVGEEVFAVELDSQSVNEAVVDWRAVPHVGHAVHALPSFVEEASVRLCRALGLTFGALDYAIDRDGRYVFFEINPNGQWAWLQLRTGVPIARAIARELRRS